MTVSLKNTALSTQQGSTGPAATGAEAEIGAYLKRRGLANKVIVATKGGHPPIFHMKGDRMNKEALEKDIDLSLKCQQLDQIDISFLHRDSG